VCKFSDHVNSVNVNIWYEFSRFVHLWANSSVHILHTGIATVSPKLLRCIKCNRISKIQISRSSACGLGRSIYDYLSYVAKVINNNVQYWIYGSLSRLRIHEFYCITCKYLLICNHKVLLTTHCMPYYCSTTAISIIILVPGIISH
jgi:hypothetical protein